MTEKEKVKLQSRVRITLLQARSALEAYAAPATTPSLNMYEFHHKQNIYALFFTWLVLRLGRQNWSRRIASFSSYFFSQCYHDNVVIFLYFNAFNFNALFKLNIKHSVQFVEHTHCKNNLNK
jgi:hypothetical protein